MTLVCCILRFEQSVDEASRKNLLRSKIEWDSDMPFARILVVFHAVTPCVLPGGGRGVNLDALLFPDPDLLLLNRAGVLMVQA